MSSLRATPEDVRHAYRLLFGREPDPTGFATFKDYIAEHHASSADVAALFFASAEFKGHHDIFPTFDEIEFNGVKLYPWRGDNLIGALVKATHEYEPHVLPEFLDCLPVGGTVLDVGANIGIYTLSAALRVGESGRVFAIEPVAKNVQSICAGIAGNKLRNVSILPVAASAEPGIIPILRNANSSNGIVDVHARSGGADGFVPSQPLDFLLAGLERLDVMKIDIEGHEPIAWPSLQVLVRKHRPIIFTEFNPVAIRNHSRVDPEIYLGQLLDEAGSIEILHADGSRTSCTSPDQVMEQWRAFNRRMGSVDGYSLDFKVDARS